MEISKAPDRLAHLLRLSQTLLHRGLGDEVRFQSDHWYQQTSQLY